MMPKSLKPPRKVFVAWCYPLNGKPYLIVASDAKDILSAEDPATIGIYELKETKTGRIAALLT